MELYIAAWGEPVIRWLLSTVPSAMIFDDHDVHDDWNTSIEWVTEMRQKDWWRRRIVAAFESYLIYQHLGNLSPSERAEFELYEHLRTAEDPTPRLREFAKQADEEVEGTRWSFCRDIGPGARGDDRLARRPRARPGQPRDGRRRRVALDRASTRTGDVDHLLIGTSLPLIMGPAMHWLEAWNEVVADGAWGKAVKKLAEKLRQELDLEHWPAFQDSFRRMCDLLREVGAGRARRGAVDDLRASAATSTTPTWPRSASRRARACSRAVWQAVCSPFRNPLDTNERRVILAAWTRAAGRVARALARARRRARSRTSAGGSRTRSRGSTTRSRWLELEGRRATFVLEKALPPEDGKGEPVLERVFERSIEPNADFART